MDWLPWSVETFARAARERKPVLLSIAAPWCRACHEMDATTYADARVQAIARDRFLAVRVDADERPDINDRYNLGGWPTTAFLTPEGALLGGGTFVSADRMPGVLARIADAFAALPAATDAGPSSLPADAAAAEPGHSVTPDDVFASYDEVHGGFGIEPKFPLTSPLLLAMALHEETGDPRWQAVVTRTLDAMADGALCDAASGGFFRYATTRDWQLPHAERVLDTNAALLTAFAHAYGLFGRAQDAARAQRLAAFITSLATPGGGYRASDASRAVYGASTAAATTALLAAATVLDVMELARSALVRFEAWLLSAYRPSAGIAHITGAGEVRGLLVDQIATIEALVAAHALTADEPYRMLAEEVAHFVVRVLRDPRGGFCDRAPQPADVGLLRGRLQPYVANCEAARVLTRLARISKEPFGDAAREALDCAAPLARAHGPDAAYWLLAAREVAIR